MAKRENDVKSQKKNEMGEKALDLFADGLRYGAEKVIQTVSRKFRDKMSKPDNLLVENKQQVLLENKEKEDSK